MTNYLRTSERNLFKRCQWAWERNYIDQIEPGQRHSLALWFGTGIHLALEKWYIPGTKRGVPLVDTWNAYCDEAESDTMYINTYMEGDFSESVEARELGIGMLKAYLEEYGEEPWKEIISPEQTFQVEVPHYEWNGIDGLDDSEAYRSISKTTYVGTFDLVYRDLRDGKLYLEDHKTAKALGASNTQYLPMDDQAGAYWAFAVKVLRDQGLIGPKEFLEGIVYNYLVKSKPDERPRNKDGYATNKPQKKHFVEALTEAGIESDKPLDKLTVGKLESISEEHGITVFGEVSSRQPTKAFDRVIVRKSPRQQINQYRRIADDLEHMSLVRNNLLKATKTPTRECGFCSFRDLCEIDEAGKDYTDMKEMLYKNWDPYAAHREEDAE